MRDHDDAFDDFPLDDEEKTFALPIPPRAPAPRASSPSAPAPSSHPPRLFPPPLLSSSPASQPPPFTCSLSPISTLLDLLSSLQLHPTRSFASSTSSSFTPPALLHCSVLPSGLKLTVHRSKSLSARAYVKANLFNDWRLREPTEQGLAFTVSLARFLHVLSVFGGDGCAVLTLEEGGEAVRMEMENEGALCDATLACVVGGGQEEDDAELNFALLPVVARGSIQSNVLRAAFAELDLPGASHFSLLLSTTVPHLRLCTQTEGVSVLSSVACSTPGLTPQQADPFIDWQFEGGRAGGAEGGGEAGLRLQYPVYLIQPTVTVLGLSDHTNVRVNEGGMLSMQHVVPTRMADVNNWVEYVCAAMEGEGDGMGEGAGGKSKWGQRLFPNEDLIVE